MLTLQVARGAAPERAGRAVGDAGRAGLGRIQARLCLGNAGLGGLDVANNGLLRWRVHERIAGGSAISLRVGFISGQHAGHAALG
ncbi:hypothetical protein [Bradyrhizobium japonicum]|uniref:hypothetical protein n=1 Tax=Bradyrhizobium japonicum TaxID=375 RepID=UPI0012BB6FD3|nr:hypothetical protein [Bradyrhizobium japonicum]